MTQSATTRTVLIVDDDADLVNLIQRFVKKLGFDSVTAHSCKAGAEMLAANHVDLMLLDMGLPDGLGLDFCKRMLPLYPDLPVIFMTGDGALETSIAAMRLGAKDFLLKPLQLEDFARSVRAVLGSATDGQSVPVAREVIGTSPAIKEVWKQISIFAGTDITVLLLGESGTGKEMFARAIHARSKRSRGPFIELDCASLPGSLIESELFGYEKGSFTDARESRPGKFELAGGGTLFLDELGNLSLEIQAKLLRVVQERAFRRIGGQKLVHADVRIIGATNLDLEQAVQRGAFRHDLFYRLSEMPLRLPALKERKGDIPKLCRHFLNEYSQRYNKQVDDISPDALRTMERHPWPGNVRELENVMRASVLRCGTRIEPADLSIWTFGAAEVPKVEQPAPPGDDAHTISIQIPWPADGSGLDLKNFSQVVKMDVERHIFRELRRRGMNKSQMARFLNIDYKVLLDKLRAIDGETQDDPS